MKKQQIIEIKLEIDHIKQYLESEICKKCEEMSEKLRALEQSIEYIQNEGE